MRRINLLVLVFLLFATQLFSQNKEQREWLLRFSEEAEKNYIYQRTIAESIAIKQKMPIRKEYPDGTVIELQRFENGIPIYYLTESNLNAAKTLSTDKVWPGGSGGFSLTGLNDTLGIWDGGKVRGTHQELTGRVIYGDGASTLSDHSTHVAGTMIASGVVSSAKGMSYQARLRGYDWNNAESEMAAAAAAGLKISNHSYGTITGWRYNYFSDGKWAWFGDPTISEVEDYGFGYYSSDAAQWDNIAYNAPYYLIVKSAGNDRGEGPTTAVEHWVRMNGSWTLSTTARDRDGGASGFDCISYKGTAKNIMTIGAVYIISSGYTNPSSVIMSSFSGWGPTDDGRIKPDVVGAGVGLYSSISTADNAYATYDGTSMSSPNVSGSIGLLINHQKNLWGNVPLRSSTLKGLVIHTADEAGSFTGPDYIYGWGLMNTLKAAQLMASNKNSGNSFFIRELTLNNNDSILLNLPIKGNQPFKATICWTDPAGVPPPPSLDPPNLMLVNDLDMRLDRGDTIFYPWVLDPSNPFAAATTGDNFRDNVEQIYIASPQKNLYTLKIKHKGTLSGGKQVFSLLISGAQNLLITYPIGGEIWYVGTIQKIKWNSSEILGNVKIEISRDGGINYETIIDSTANDGEESWLVTGPASNISKIRISSIDFPENNDVSSGYITILAPSLRVIYPNGGEIFNKDTIITIRWSVSEIPGKIKVELSRDGGINYEILYDSVENNGNIDWLVTGPYTEYARIRLSSVIEPMVFDISDSNFTILAPYINISFPNSKSLLTIDSVYEILWNSFLADNYINIDLSRDGGLSYESLFMNIPNVGSKQWTVSGPATDRAILRISNANPPELIGYSSGYFTIGNVFSVTYNEKWNLVSIPIKTSENRKSILFSSSNSNAFGYTPGLGYEICDELMRVKGYWLKYPAVTQVNFIGAENIKDSINLIKGWNLVGSISSPLSVNSISTSPADIIDAFLYEYSGKYSIADSISPGKAYWLKVSSNGVLYLDANNPKLKTSVLNKQVLNNYNTIKFVDKSGFEQILYFTSSENVDLGKYDLPPLPPNGAFDIRFSSNKVLETINNDFEKYIKLQSVKYPLKVEWDIKDNNNYMLHNSENIQIIMKGKGSSSYANEGESILFLKLISSDQNLIPSEYSLNQNFPNPFNSTTQISFSIPKDEFVSLKVYNVLGIEIATLVNGYKLAGNYKIDWDASSVPSGIYLYKLTSGNFTSIKKMLLIR